MLIKIKRLLVENEGYKTNVSLQEMYVNSSNIISISNYTGAENFLLREKSELSQESFSLIKINEGDSTDNIIAFGTAEQIYSQLNTQHESRLLHD